MEFENNLHYYNENNIECFRLKYKNKSNYFLVEMTWSFWLAEVAVT